MPNPIVTVETGKLQGTIGKDINGKDFYAFRGIPYGKSIGVGDARFKAPEPVEPWTGIRDATNEGDECYARDIFFTRKIVGTENCLILNVYTPTITGNTIKKPVMVWIHGGGFTSGSSNSSFLGPEFLVAEDVVLVTINYRLHVLGFLCLEDPSLDVPGNAGMKDMVLALKWVQKNIGNFGGDPTNVTIFGDSAGGGAVHYLVLSPSAKGLFHKAIIQSGVAIHSWTRGGRPSAIELGKELGLTTTNEKELLEHFRKIPIEQLYEAVEKIYDEFVPSCKRPYGPVIERNSKNAFLTEEPMEIMKSGNYNHVPIMIGYTNREGMLVHALDKDFNQYPDFEAQIPYKYNIEKGSEISKLIAEKLKTFYYGNEKASVNNKDKLYLLIGDSSFTIDILNTVKYHSQNAKQPIYLYRVSIESQLNMFKRFYQLTDPGAAHADDVGYLFKNTMPTEITSGSVEDLGRRRFCKMWSNFAKYGNPNPNQNDDLINVEWKPVTTQQLNFVDIGKELTAGVNPEKERLEFWNEIVKMCPKNKAT